MKIRKNNPKKLGNFPTEAVSRIGSIRSIEGNSNKLFCYKTSTKHNPAPFKPTPKHKLENIDAFKTFALSFVLFSIQVKVPHSLQFFRSQHVTPKDKQTEKSSK